MEIQLQELIDRIKKDGVEVAEGEAKTIVDTAKAEAEKIVADAKAEAEKIMANAKQETERMVRSGEDAIRQAGRNLLISFRDSVTRQLKAITAENVSAVFSADSFAELIVSAVSGWAASPDAEELSVILNSKELARLEETVLAGIKAKMLNGVTLKANDNFDGGFRIAVKDGAVYYDYSADAVVDMLSGYLSPRVTALLKEAE